MHARTRTHTNCEDKVLLCFGCRTHGFLPPHTHINTLALSFPRAHPHLRTVEGGVRSRSIKDMCTKEKAEYHFYFIAFLPRGPLRSFSTRRNVVEALSSSGVGVAAGACAADEHDVRVRPLDGRRICQTVILFFLISIFVFSLSLSLLSRRRLCETREASCFVFPARAPHVVFFL